MEQKKPHARSEEFTEQFTTVMYDHWSGILQTIERQSPRIAALLRAATPTGLKRINGIWRVRVLTRHAAQHQPRDKEIIAQAIRLYYHHAARLKLPRIIVEFEP